ncbi:MAG: biotin/lipoyl-containing protein [Oceanipulchritudo sp.]
MKKQFRITLNGKSYEVVAEIIGEEEAAPTAPAGAGARSARSASAAPVAPESAPKAAASGEAGDVPSPLAGKVVSVDVAIGAQIQAGQKVMTLEAMKMNTVVSSPAAGTVKAIHVSAGDSVEEGQPLLSLQ